MAKQRSDKSCYPSRYGGGNVTIAQYITEYLCENIAKAKKKDLPQQFWQLEEWGKFFRTQITLLNRQILPYIHPRAVVKALKDYRCFAVNSFGGFMKVPKWKNVLVEYDKICRIEDEKNNKLKEHIVTDATKEQPRQVSGKKHIFNTLREIEHGERERPS